MSVTTTRQLILGIDPLTGDNFTLAFGHCIDGNPDRANFLCGYCPPQKGTGMSVLQECVFLGTTVGTGLTFAALIDALSMDGGSMAIRGRCITHRIDPDARADVNQVKSSTTKRYLKLILGGNNPMQFGLKIQWTKDQDPLGPFVVWQDISGDPDDTVLYFENGLANFIHLKIDDSTNIVGKVVLPPLSIGYYGIGDRDSKDR